MRDSGLPADVLVGKLEKDISFALRRGTIAQVTTHALDAAQRAADDELALNEAGWDRYTASTSSSHLRRRFDPSYLVCLSSSFSLRLEPARARLPPLAQPFVGQARRASVLRCGGRVRVLLCGVRELPCARQPLSTVLG
jgi:hypothetical protein